MNIYTKWGFTVSVGCILLMIVIGPFYDQRLTIKQKWVISSMGSLFFMAYCVMCSKYI